MFDRISLRFKMNRATLFVCVTLMLFKTISSCNGYFYSSNDSKHDDKNCFCEVRQNLNKLYYF